MKLLFVEGATRFVFDTEGNVYTGANLPASIQERYSKYCDNLVILHKSNMKAYPKSELPEGLHKVDRTLADIVAVPDLYRPRKNLLSFSVRREIKRIMSRAIQDADRVIIRLGINYYTVMAEKLCRKYKKPYLIEVVECVFDMNWYYGIEGKIVAPFSELRARRIIRRAPYVVYVTQHELQKRYPTKGKSLGCSDVELPVLDNSVLENRIKYLRGGQISSYSAQRHFLEAA